MQNELKARGIVEFKTTAPTEAWLPKLTQARRIFEDRAAVVLSCGVTGKTHSALTAMIAGEIKRTNPTSAFFYGYPSYKSVVALFQRHGVKCRRRRDILRGEVMGIPWQIKIIIRKPK